MASTEPDPSARISDLVRQLIQHAVLNNERIARLVGLNVVDLQTFGLIAGLGEATTPSAVTARTGLPSSTTTRVLDRLEKAGFVVRRPDPADRRRTEVQAVPEKLAELQTHYAGIVKGMEALNATRTREQLATVADYLADLLLVEEDGQAVP